MKILKTNSAICSFIYYFADNIVWFSKIGFISKFVPFSPQVWGSELKWGKVKDLFSLLKTIFELWIYIYTLYLKFKEDAILMKKLDAFDDQKIKRNHLSYVYLRKLVILRREIRFIMVEILIYSSRMILLTKGLKLVGHNVLDPIFVSVCGLF